MMLEMLIRRGIHWWKGMSLLAPGCHAMAMTCALMIVPSFARTILDHLLGAEKR